MGRSGRERPRWVRGLALCCATTFGWSVLLASPVQAWAHRIAPPRIGVRTLTTKEMQKIVGQVSNQVPQASTETVTVNGTQSPAGGATWDILDTVSSVVVANNTTTNGWNVTGTGPYTVSAPGSALLGSYRVRKTGSSGDFVTVQPATTLASGPSYRWEASVAGVNTFNGNKLTAIPVVGWTAKGGLPVQFTLYHNSQSAQNLYLGPKWSHSYDLYLIGTTDMTIHWGNDLAYTFTKNMDGSYTAPTGIFDTLVKNGDSTYTLTTKEQVKYEFNTSLRCTAIKDGHSNTLTLGYGLGSNKVLTITDSSGRVLTLNYALVDGEYLRINSITDPQSRVWTLSYDANGNLWKVNKPLLAGDSTVYKTTLSYNSNNCITTLTTPRGKNWTFQYYMDNSLQWMKDPLLNQTSFNFTATDKYVTDANGLVTTLSYTSGRLTKVTDPLTYYTEYTWDTSKNCCTNIRDKRAYNWQYTYDSAGNVLTATDPYSNVTTTTWNSKNRVTQVTNDLGHYVVYTYDTNNLDCLKIEAKHQNGTLQNKTEFTYKTTGLLETVKDGLTHITTLAYDTDGNLDSVTQAPTASTTLVTSFDYDTLGRLTKKTDPLGHENNYQYDNWGRSKTTLQAVIPGQNNDTGYLYDVDDNVTKVTDALGHTVEYTYDDAGRVTQVKKLRGTGVYDIVTYAYDGTGQKGLLSSKADGNGRTTTYSYSNRNELASATYPVSSGVTTGESWTYNPNGDMATHVDGKSQTISYVYDNASRLITIDYPTGTDTSFGYDDINRLTSLTDSTGTTGYTYDAADRLTQIASPNGTVSYTYDAASRRDTMVIAGSPNQTYTYGYDNADRLTSIQNPFSETTSFDYTDTAYGNSLNGYMTHRLAKQTFSNGSALTYGYDDRDRVSTLSSKKYVSGTWLWQWQHAYLYDDVGNVAQRTDYEGDPGDGIYKRSSFVYDHRDQLTRETFTSNLSGSTQFDYTYDYNSNRTKWEQRTNGTLTTTTNYSHDWQDRLTQAVTGSTTKSYGYDNNGNCTQIQVNGTTTATLGYDYENRVTSIAQTGITTNTFTYNGFNLRQSKVDSAGTFNYVTDGSSPASAVLKDGAATYTLGISERRSTTSKFYHTDGLGSVRGITDSSQNTTDTALYEAFGQVVNRTGTTPTPFGFAGEWQYQTDANTNLQLLGHRYYDPSIGRFLSKDPIGDGDNWYAYCENNPLIKVDANGLQASPGNKGGRGDNKKLDPEQVKSLREKLQEIIKNGNKQSDRKERNEIEQKLKTHEKGVGIRPHGQAGDNRQREGQQDFIDGLVKAGTIVIVGGVIWEIGKWGIAIITAPATAGGSLVVAGGLP